MAERMFRYGEWAVEARGTPAELDTVCNVHGGCWSLDGGHVVIDWDAQMVWERPGARLSYRILHRSRQVVSVSGAGPERMRHGGQSVLSTNAYMFY